MAALASMLEPKITAQSVNKYEKGEMMPSSTVLRGLSNALSVTTDYLLSSQVAGLSNIEFRKRAGVSERDKAGVTEQVLDYVERYLAIESVLGLSDEPTGFDDVESVVIDDLDEAEGVAERIRSEWGLGEDPISSVTVLLEEQNVRVIEIDGADGFYGMTCSVQRPGNASSVPVVIRRHVNVERDRFTLAHEICHSFISDCRNAKLEKAIDRCAGALLMPAKHLMKEVGARRRSVSYPELVALKHIYGVSIWALIYRLGDLGVISSAEIKNLFRTPARTWLKSEPAALADAGDIAQLEKPRRFESLVYRALAEGLIQTNRAATMLKKPVGDVEAAIRGPI